MSVLPAPDFTAGSGIDCLDLTALHLCRRNQRLAAPVGHAFAEWRAKSFEGSAGIHRRRVEQLGLWAISSMRPFLRACGAWTDLDATRGGFEPHRNLSIIRVNVAPRCRRKFCDANQFP